MASQSVDSSTKGNDSPTPAEPGVAQIWMGDVSDPCSSPPTRKHSGCAGRFG